MSDRDDRPTGPETEQERELLETYRELDEADQVLIWSVILTELSRRPGPDENNK